MELTIKLMGGDETSLEMSEEATVGELKQRISQLFGEPPTKQKLSADNGTHISLDDDSRTLSSYGLDSGSVVSLLITNPGPSQVLVKNEEGQTGTYDADVNETVDQLQPKIYNKLSVPNDQQRLQKSVRKLQQYDITPLTVRSHQAHRLRGFQRTQLRPH
uniref:ISG15 ubiquitin like modifier n=1 Tax=Cyprinus carpio TaxID=7962 RepID=A0A8C1QUV1_CYPCA